MKIITPLRSPAFGGLSDQALVSFCNFALNIVLVRCISGAEYGRFSFVLSVIVFLNSIHQAFVTYPLSVHGASASGREFDRLLAGAVSATAVGGLMLVPLLAGAAASVGLVSLIVPASIAMLAWQLQEVCRRGFLAQWRFGRALRSDCFRYCGVLACVVGLSAVAPVSLPAVFAAIAAGSAAGAAVLIAVFLRGASGSTRGILQTLPGRLRLTGPVIAANVLAAFSNQWFLWTLTWTHGFASSGALVALANIAAVSSPVIFGIENIILPEISRERTRRSSPPLAKLISRRLAAGGLLIGPVLTGIAFWPGEAARLVYGRATDFAQFAPCLQLLAISYLAFFCSTALTAVLRAYCLSRAVFIVQLWPAIFGITAGSLLIKTYGLEGACLATCLAAVLRVLIAIYFVMQIRELTRRNNITILSRSGGSQYAAEDSGSDELAGAR